MQLEPSSRAESLPSYVLSICLEPSVIFAELDSWSGARCVAQGKKLGAAALCFLHGSGASGLTPREAQ